MPQPITLEFLTEQLAVADELLARRSEMENPQDLPGRSRQFRTRLGWALPWARCATWPCLR
jgi:hypothetical protein